MIRKSSVKRKRIIHQSGGGVKEEIDYHYKASNIIDIHGDFHKVIWVEKTSSYLDLLQTTALYSIPRIQQ